MPITVIAEARGADGFEAGRDNNAHFANAAAVFPKSDTFLAVDSIMLLAFISHELVLSGLLALFGLVGVEGIGRGVEGFVLFLLLLSRIAV